MLPIAPLANFKFTTLATTSPNLRDLGTNRDSGVGVDFGDFVLHQPAREIEVVNRVAVKQHSVDVRVVGGKRRAIFVSANAT